MKPKTTFIIIALLVVGLFVYNGFEKQEELEREQYYYELTHFPKPTDTPTPLPKIDWDEYNKKFEEKGSLYYNQKGEIFKSENVFENQIGEIKIDRISYYFEEWYDGTYHLNMSLEGQLISGNADFYLKYKLYDEEDFVVDDGVFKIDNLSEGDKFKSEELIIRDLDKIGTYTLKIMDYE